MKLAFVAGELSGDQLGGAIIEALRRERPDIDCLGLTGPRMEAAGCRSLGSIEQLSLMGLAEILPALPRLFRLRATLVQQIVAAQPDAVVSIDAPDFNLGLQQRLRERGLHTVHVVSPTIWAWRAGRIKGIRRAVRQMLCLFPFEPVHYAGSGVRAEFIGHPLADEIHPAPDTAAARAHLGLADRVTLAVLPGSRGGEVRHLAPVFAQTVARLSATLPGLQVVTPVAKPALREGLAAQIRQWAPNADWRLIDGQAHQALAAANAVLLASGTATLETLLVGRAMVVGYRTAPLTAWLMIKGGLLKTRHVSLPNLLSRTPTVPERLQAECNPLRLAADVMPLLVDGAARQVQLDAFADVRQQLAVGAAQQAARAILSGLAARP